MNEADLSLDLLLQETLAMTEYLRLNNHHSHFSESIQQTDIDVEQNYDEDGTDQTHYQDLVQATISQEKEAKGDLSTQVRAFPKTPGIIYKIDNSSGTFCIRGFSSLNISDAFAELANLDSAKRSTIKLEFTSSLDSVEFFETKTLELADAIRLQIINRRFPHQEDTLCNLSDPGFSWWMSIDPTTNERFEIFFRSHGINRAEKYIQLGPIGDSTMAALRMNQARTLLRSSFPISEFSCDDKSFTVASSKPDHLSFIAFQDIFQKGVNLTELENFPDNSMGRTLYYYFHELAIVRKFWIEVKTKLG